MTPRTVAEPAGITTLLIANRGEIAVRVIRGARQAGLRTVAVYSDADREAQHVREADVAVRLGPAPAAQSYLDTEAVLRAARQAGADAVHPGYGFLSERAAFAHAVRAAGLVFVGPSPEVMEQMGRKDAAREVAVAAGVPVVPSARLSEDGRLDAGEVGFPLLVKAAAGGGGKGMRVVRSAEELPDALAAAQREARSAFGDDTMLLERYVERGRHIEVQVLADAHGNVVHLYERDCSTQRRHQKVIEEAPAPTISAQVRRVVTESAVALARQVGYQNAGTVEFLVDEDAASAGRGEGVYFLEMNTRLQVEHPVTELVVSTRSTGAVDLVRLQLDVAAGRPLPFGQDELAVHGHAFEARVYAEDAFNGFLPQAGTAALVRWPGARADRFSAQAGGVRVDAALESGQVVSTAYDPMLGKIIVHGPDRETARRALVGALDATAVLGLTTNVGFLRALAAGDALREATIDTAWLDRTEVPEPGPDTARVFAAWTEVFVLTEVASWGHPFQGDGFRLGSPPAPVTVELDRPVVVDRATGRVDGVPVERLRADHHVVVLGIDGSREQAVVNVSTHEVEVVHRGHRHVFTRPDAFGPGSAAETDGRVVAPMPGTVLSVAVAEDETVAEGQVLGVLEAMKMELSLRAPLAGTVTMVGATVGAQVALGAELFTVEPG